MNAFRHRKIDVKENRIKYALLYLNCNQNQTRNIVTVILFISHFYVLSFNYIKFKSTTISYRIRNKSYQYIIFLD